MKETRIELKITFLQKNENLLVLLFVYHMIHSWSKKVIANYNDTNLLI